MRIKKEMYNLVPPIDDQFLDEGTIGLYCDKVYDSLLYIFSELKCVTSDIFGNDSIVMKRVLELENRVRDNFYSCGYDIYKLRLFYKDCISHMKKDFLDSVKKTCVGYYSFRGVEASMKADSINEMLHFIHSFILNNEDILGSIPIVNKKDGSYEPIIYRGYKVPMFENLFNTIDENLDIGTTDMVAVSDRKMLMMVRDKGHALPVEITLNGKNARLEYFVPKLCNVDMGNNLPGINRVNKDSAGVTGVIEVPVEDLNNCLYDFISKVPTDSDIIHEHNFDF